MFSKRQIADKLYGIVGLRQPYNSEFAILDSFNSSSRSGYYSNDNPFAKVEFLLDNLDYPEATDAQKNKFIKDLQISAITDVCNLVFDEQDFIDRQYIFNNTINKVDLENTYNGFCGFEILMDIEKNVSFEIPRIVLNFSGVGTIRLGLFNSAVTEPLFTKDVTISSDFQIEDLGWYVNGATKEYQGRYYIGYIRDSSTVPVPFKRNYYNSVIISAIKFMQIRPVHLIPTTMDDMVLGDLRHIQYVFERHGINPDINVFYDFTDLICRQERLFAKAIDLAFQMKIINTYLVSTRSNRNERISAELMNKAIAEIDGITPVPGGIKKIGIKRGLNDEVDSLKVQIKKLKNGYMGSDEALQVVTLT